MSPLVITIVAVAVLALLFHIGAIWARGHVYSTLEGLVSEGNLDAFFRRVEAPSTRALLAPYGRELLRFRALAAKGDRTAMAEQFERLMKLKLTAYERSCVLTEGFNAFAGAHDAKRCRRIVEEMGKGGFADKALPSYRRHLEVVLEHKPSGRKQLEDAYEQLKGKRRAYAAYLLSKICESTHDAEAAASYRASAASLYGCTETELDRRAHVVTSV